MLRLHDSLSGMPPGRRAAFRMFLLSLLLGTAPAAAQERPPEMSSPVAASPTGTRMASFEAKEAARPASLLNNVAYRNVGPTVMSGRVVDVDVSTADPTRFYVAYASGGLWRTTTNGISFEPLFDREASMTIGDIAVDWAHGETIWVGTGENNSSRSSYAGTGVYRSTDGGTTWQHVGLTGTQRTGRIVLHPDDPETVWVAAIGPLYSTSPERGVYKTTDGGQTWRKTLFVDDTTGVIDLVIDPADPNTLYAAAWHRARRAWNFVEAGRGSGIFKSTDGGETWTRLNTEASGFPTGEHVGRIGLAIFPGQPETLYALLDNQARRPEEEAEDLPLLTRETVRTMSRDSLLAVGEEALQAYLERNGFPAAYTAQSVLEMLREGRIDPVDLVTYLEDANQALFETPVVGAEVYRSDDGGQTWRRTHATYLDDVYYSYGYYFGEIRVAPDDVNRIYVMGVPILKSEDGGQTFSSINEENVHVDHHALWVSPTRPGHLVNGNDGGVNVTYDDGATWYKANSPAVGQFYAVQVDDATPYRVYGGLQDNGVWVGPSTYEADYGWHGEGDYPYDRLLGGDGMQVEVDLRTDEIVYTGFQFGNYFRINRTTGETEHIQPRHELGERPLRFNWNTPIHLSRHQQDILYLGSNRFHRSLNRGDDWQTLSGDLTKGGRPGDVPYGTISTIDESPLRFGLLYVGTDDGLVHVSRDGGYSWARISEGLPQDFWVSRVEASNHAEGRVYVSLNGYRWDHFEPYLYRSDDYGQTWERIGTDLPAEPVNVVTEDPENERILYVGTDHGLYVTLDGGASFMAMDEGLPYAPVHDIKVQAREKELVAGTHGRSIYIADIEHVQQLTPEMLARPLHLFAIEPATYDDGWGAVGAAWIEPAVPEVELPYFAGTAGTATIRILAEDGTLLQQRSDTAERGLNYVTYDLTADSTGAATFRERAGVEDEDTPRLEPADDGKIYLVPGTYTVEIALGEEVATGTLEVKASPERERGGAPRMEPSEADEIK